MSRVPFIECSSAQQSTKNFLRGCLQKIVIYPHSMIRFNSIYIFTHISSSSPLFRASFAMTWKASSTFMPSFAEVSKYGIFPFEAHQARAFFSETWRNSWKPVSIMISIMRENHILWKTKKRKPKWLKEILTTLLFPPSTSTLFPITTNGKFSGSEGLACMRQTIISYPCFIQFRSLTRFHQW